MVLDIWGDNPLWIWWWRTSYGWSWMIVDHHGWSLIIHGIRWALEVLVDNDGLQDGSQRKEARRCWSVVGWLIPGRWWFCWIEVHPSWYQVSMQHHPVNPVSSNPPEGSQFYQVSILFASNFSGGRPKVCPWPFSDRLASRRQPWGLMVGLRYPWDWWWLMGLCLHINIWGFCWKTWYCWKQPMGTWLEYDGIYPPVNNIGMVGATLR